ncbi:MAG TPA: hypothetical protein DD412_04930 [Holosporales bacterium]|nr:hypothetical protein [Holosporales bacterium]
MAQSGSNKRKKNKHLIARCDEEEYILASIKAEKAGLSLSAYICHLLFGKEKNKTTRPPPRSQRDAAQIIGLLGQIAQSLRDYCQKRNIPPDDPILAAAMRDLADIKTLCFDELGRKQ